MSKNSKSAKSKVPRVSTLRSMKKDAAASDRKLMIEKRESIELQGARAEERDLEAAKWGQTKLY